MRGEVFAGRAACDRVDLLAVADRPRAPCERSAATPRGGSGRSTGRSRRPRGVAKMCSAARLKLWTMPVGVDRDDRVGRGLDDAPVAFLRHAQRGFRRAPVGDVAQADDEAANRRIGELVAAAGLEPAIGAVGWRRRTSIGGASTTVSRRSVERTASATAAWSSGWTRSKAETPTRSSGSKPSPTADRARDPHDARRPRRRSR